MNEVDLDADVELGELVEAKPSKGRGPVVAIRLSADLLARVNEYAQARGLTVSEVLRRGAEQITSGATAAGAVYYTGGELRGPGLIHGSPTTGSARTAHGPKEQSTVEALTSSG